MFIAYIATNVLYDFIYNSYKTKTNELILMRNSVKRKWKAFQRRWRKKQDNSNNNYNEQSFLNRFTCLFAIIFIWISFFFFSTYFSFLRVCVRVYIYIFFFIRIDNNLIRITFWYFMKEVFFLFFCSLLFVIIIFCLKCKFWNSFFK